MTYAQELPLSISGIERLLKDGVGQDIVAKAIRDRGISFELTAEMRARLTKLGAGTGVMKELDHANKAYVKTNADTTVEKATSSSFPGTEKQVTRVKKPVTTPPGQSTKVEKHPGNAKPSAGDCQSINEKAKLEALNQVEIEFLRKGCR